MKIAITGASGFIGQNLCELLYTCTNYNVVPIDRGNEDIIQTLKPNIICHLAANPIVKDGDYNSIQDNINLTARVLDCAKNTKKIPHIVFLSSATVYGSVQTASRESSILNPSSIYAATKIASEYLIQAYANLGYINYTILRSVANTGKHCTHGVVKDIMSKLRTDNDHIDIIGEYPGSCKPYIYVRDTALSIKHCIDNKIYGVFNLSTMNTIFISEVVDIIESVLGIKKSHIWLGKDSTWSGDDNSVSLDNSLLLKTGLTYIATTSEEAIRMGVKQICQT